MPLQHGANATLYDEQISKLVILGDLYAALSQDVDFAAP